MTVPRDSIKNVFEEGELQSDSTVAFFATVQTEGKRKVERDIAYYNLDMIISVGYRVHSYRGVLFRQWATAVLKEKIFYRTVLLLLDAYAPKSDKKA